MGAQVAEAQGGGFALVDVKNPERRRMRKRIRATSGGLEKVDLDERNAPAAQDHPWCTSAMSAEREKPWVAKYQRRKVGVSREWM